MQMYDLLVPILSGPFVCCNFTHYLFRKVFMQDLNPEISKLHFPDRLFSTVYVLIVEELLVPKILHFLFSQPVTNTQLSRLFTSANFSDHFLISAYYYEVGHLKL